jgi:hypothetical protein
LCAPLPVAVQFVQCKAEFEFQVRYECHHLVCVNLPALNNPIKQHNCHLFLIGIQQTILHDNVFSVVLCDQGVFVCFQVVEVLMDNCVCYFLLFRCVEMEESAPRLPFHRCSATQDILPVIYSISPYVGRQFHKAQPQVKTKQQLLTFCSVDADRILIVLNFLRKAEPINVGGVDVGLITVERMIKNDLNCHWFDIFKKIWQTLYDEIFNVTQLAAQWLTLVITNELCVTNSPARFEFLHALSDSNGFVALRVDVQRHISQLREAKRRKVLCARSSDMLMSSGASLSVLSQVCGSEINELIRTATKILKGCLRSAYLFIGSVYGSGWHEKKFSFFVDLENITAVEQQQRTAIENIAQMSLSAFVVFKDAFVSKHSRHLFFRTRLFAGRYNIWEEAKWTLYNDFIDWHFCNIFLFASLGLLGGHTKNSLTHVEVWLFDYHRGL